MACILLCGMENTVFSARQRIRRWKSAAGAFHLLTLSGFVLCLTWLLPVISSQTTRGLSQAGNEQAVARQMLLEALDRLVRYQHYYYEIHGRFTRDLARLSLPGRLAGGDLEELQRSYEISVTELEPKRFLLLATGIHSTDRVTVDESRRLNANFALPNPSRAYLLEEADRVLALRSQGAEPLEGLYSAYWQVAPLGDGQGWVAVGTKKPVAGERREYQGERVLASIFAEVSERVKTKMTGKTSKAKPKEEESAEFELDQPRVNLFKEQLSSTDVQEWLENARVAQHVHKREHGHFAKKWERLDGVSDYHFFERIQVAKNVRVHPIEITGDGKDFRLTIEGTSGDLMGEQFVVDSSGSVRQVRYTEALINQLQESTNLLENTFRFQINPIADDPSRRSQP
jgi:hypothetical protein